MWHLDYSLPTPPSDEVEIASINESGTPSMCIAGPEWNFDAIAESQEFLDLSFQEVIDIIRRDELRVSSEHVVFDAVVRWLRKSKERLAFRHDIMVHVRFPLCTMDFLTGIVDLEPLMHVQVLGDHSCMYLSENAKRYRSLSAKSRAQKRNNGNEVRTRTCYASPKVVYIFGQPRGDERRCVECYDIWTDTWSRIEGGIPLASAGVTVHQNRIWFIGGGNSLLQACRETFSFDPRDGGWRIEKDLLRERRDLGAAVLNGKLYAVGGSDGVKATETTEVYEYVGGEWNWWPCAPMNTKRTRFGIATLDNKLYAVGGRCGNGSKSRSVEFYSDRITRWTKARCWSLVTERMPCQIVAIDEILYLVGGDSDDTMQELNPAAKVTREQPYHCRSSDGDVIVTASDEKIYVAQADLHGISSPYMSCYDPTTEIWTSIPRPHGYQKYGTKAVVFDRAVTWPYMEQSTPNFGCFTQSCRYNNSPLSPPIFDNVETSRLSYSDVLAVIPKPQKETSLDFLEKRTREKRAKRIRLEYPQT